MLKRKLASHQNIRRRFSVLPLYLPPVHLCVLRVQSSDNRPRQSENRMTLCHSIFGLGIEGSEREGVMGKREFPQGGNTTIGSEAKMNNNHLVRANQLRRSLKPLGFRNCGAICSITLPLRSEVASEEEQPVGYPPEVLSIRIPSIRNTLFKLKWAYDQTVYTALR